MLHDIFQAWVRKTPTALAFQYESEEAFTYQDLDMHSDKLADYLIKHEVQPGDEVGVYFPRSAWFVVSMLALSKIGATYVPIKVSDTEDSIDVELVITKHCRLKHFLTHESLSNKASKLFKPNNTYTFRNLSDLAPFTKPTIERKEIEGNFAYIVYSSGTTGDPKGIPHYHDGFHYWSEEVMAKLLPADQVKHVLDQVAEGFDAHHWQYIRAWTFGAMIHMVSEATRTNPSALKTFMCDHKITDATILPGFFLQIMKVKNALADLESHGCQRIDFTGAKLETQIVREVIAHNILPINCYGSTEEFYGHSMYLCGLNDINEELKLVRIGHSNSSQSKEFIRFFDEEGNPTKIVALDTVKDGAGELLTTSDFMTPGYYGNEEKTRESFKTIVCESDGKTYPHVFHTGDLIEMREGVIYVSSRYGARVKFNGHWINTNEIERVILDALDDTEVSVFLINYKESELLIAVVNKELHQRDIIELKRQISEKKISTIDSPSRFFSLKELGEPKMPLNANQKRDVLKLSRLAYTTLESQIVGIGCDEYELPNLRKAVKIKELTRIRQKIENSLQRIICEIKPFLVGEELKQIKLTEVGFVSMEFIRMKAEISKQLRQDLPNELFEGTAWDLATALFRPYVFSCGFEYIENKTDDFPADAPTLFCMPPVDGGGAVYSEFVFPGMRTCTFSSPLLNSHCQEKNELSILVHESMENMSFSELGRCLLINIRNLQVTGPYYLAGFSLGGDIAFMLCDLLTRQEKQSVKLVGLIDPPAPKSLSALTEQEREIKLRIITEEILTRLKSQRIYHFLEGKYFLNFINNIPKGEMGKEKITYFFETIIGHIDALLASDSENAHLVYTVRNIFITIKLFLVAFYDWEPASESMSNAIFFIAKQGVRGKVECNLEQWKPYIKNNCNDRKFDVDHFGIMTEPEVIVLLHRNLIDDEKIIENIYSEQKFEKISGVQEPKKLEISKLYQNYKQRHAQKQQFDASEGTGFYIEPRAVHSINDLDNEEAGFELIPRINSFLSSDEIRMLFIEGETGSGKSELFYHLEEKLWSDFILSPYENPIPVHIDLGKLATLLSHHHDFNENPTNFLDYYFKLLGYSDEEITLLSLSNMRFVFLFDAYDEFPFARVSIDGKLEDKLSNLYDDNDLSIKWKSAKLMMSCRSIYLKTLKQRTSERDIQYKLLFEPRNARMISIVLARFTKNQFKEYIHEYSERNQWAEEKYLTQINKIPFYEVLIKTPLLIKMLLSVLPECEYENFHSFNQSDLYKRFFKQWFVRELDKIPSNRRLNLHPDSFVLFSEHIAFLMFQYGKESGVRYEPIGEEEKLLNELYGDDESNDSLHKYFSDTDSAQNELRRACPIVFEDGFYRFYHKSFMEYFIASFLKKTLLLDASDDRWNSKILNRDKLEKHYLNQRLLLDSPEIIHFLNEMIGDNEMHKAKLFQIVSLSQRCPEISVAAANAITVLNWSGYSFAGRDLSYTHIPYADLSNGNFDHTQFTGANLKGVNFSQAWLRMVDFTGAILTQVTFGESPYIIIPDAKKVIAVTNNMEWVAFLTLENLIRVRRLDGQAKAIEAFEKLNLQEPLIFSENSQCFASCESNDQVILKSLYGKQKHLKFQIGDHVSALAISHDSAWLAVGTQLGQLHLFSTVSSHSNSWKAHRNEITAIVFSHSGRWIASTGLDNIIYIWSTKSGECYDYINNLKTHFLSLAFSKNDELLIGGNREKDICIWQLPVVKKLGQRQMHTGRVTHLACSPTEQWLASSSRDKSICIWSMPDCYPNTVLHAHTHNLTSLTFSQDGKWLISCSEDNVIRRWAVASFEKMQEKNKRLQSPMINNFKNNVMAISHDCHLIASWENLRTVTLFSVKENQYIDFLSVGGRIWNLKFSPDNQYLVGFGQSKNIYLWSLTNSRKINVLHGHIKSVNDVSFSPNSEYLASVSKNGDIRIWLVHNGSCIVKLWDHQKAVQRVVFSPDGECLATVGKDMLVRLWSIAEYNSQIVVSESAQISVAHNIDILSFSPDNESLAIVAADHSIQLYTLKTAHAHQKLLGHVAKVTAIAYSLNGCWLASAGYNYDLTIKLWSVTENALEKEFRGHESTISAIAFSEDNQWILSGSDDKTIRIWSVENGNCQAILPANRCVRHVSWIPHTRKIIVLVNGGYSVWEPLDDYLRSWKMVSSNASSLNLDGCKIDDDALKTLSKEQRELVIQRSSSKNSDNIEKRFIASSSDERYDAHQSTARVMAERGLFSGSKNADASLEVSLENMVIKDDSDDSHLQRPIDSSSKKL